MLFAPSCTHQSDISGEYLYSFTIFTVSTEKTKEEWLHDLQTMTEYEFEQAYNCDHKILEDTVRYLYSSNSLSGSKEPDREFVS